MAKGKKQPNPTDVATKEALGDLRRKRMTEEIELHLSQPEWKWLKAFFPKKDTISLAAERILFLRDVYLFAADRFRKSFDGVTDILVSPELASIDRLLDRTEGTLQREGQAALAGPLLVAFVGSPEHQQLRNQLGGRERFLPPPEPIDVTPKPSRKR